MLVVETTERHLASLPFTNLDRAELASYLGAIASVIFFAEMEENLKAIVRARLSHSGDQKLVEFLSKTTEQLVNRMKRSEISETVALFGEGCKDDFQKEFPPQQLAIYSNVIRERHLTSHGQAVTVTINDVRSAMEVAERILEAVERIIA